MAEPMKNETKIKIIIGNLGRSKESGIYVDGVKIPNTHNIEFAAPVGELPSIRVDMWAYEVEIECDGADLTLGIDEIREMLAAAHKQEVAEKEAIKALGDLAEKREPLDVTPHGVRFREFT